MFNSRTAAVLALCTVSTLTELASCQSGLTEAVIASYAPRVSLTGSLRSPARDGQISYVDLLVSGVLVSQRTFLAFLHRLCPPERAGESLTEFRGAEHYCVALQGLSSLSPSSNGVESLPRLDHESRWMSTICLWAGNQQS